MNHRMRALGPVLCAAMVALLFAHGPGRGQEKKGQDFTSDLFPLKVGHRWTYLGSDGKERIVIAVEKQETIKRKIKVDERDKFETLESYYLRITSGDKSLVEQVFVADDGVYRFSAAGKEITPPLKILALPPQKGEVWSVDSETETLKLRGKFVVDQIAVTVPAGSYVAWSSTARDFFLGDQKLEATYWFAPKVGIVKQHVKVGKYDLKLELEKFEPAIDKSPATISVPSVPVGK
jgi:hypothetical protein